MSHDGINSCMLVRALIKVYVCVEYQILKENALCMQISGLLMKFKHRKGVMASHRNFHAKVFYDNLTNHYISSSYGTVKPILFSLL